MKRLFNILLLLIQVFGLNLALGQSHFRIVGDIPHLPVLDPTVVASPELGMLILSSVDAKPLIYTGTGWETLCTGNISANSPQDFFVVKHGIPYLPSLINAPLNPQSGSIYYSTATKAVMVYNGILWSKMVDLTTGTVNDNSGFSSGKELVTYKLPVMSNNPVVQGLSAGAIYINSSSKTIRYYNGSNWNDIACYPAVITSPVSNNISGYTATGGGNVLTDGGTNIISKGVCWNTSIDPDTTLSTKTVQISGGSGIGTYISNLVNLLPNTKYYVRAYACNLQGVAYGDNVLFTTPLAVPEITTLPLNKLTNMTAESGGNITADGGAQVTHRGVRYSATADPLIDSSSAQTNDGSGLGTYASSLSSLLGNTTYYLRAYATNSVGTAYGNLIQFTTTAAQTPGLDVYLTIDSITGSSAVGTSALLNNGGAVITDKGLCYSTDKVSYQCVSSSDTTPFGIGSFKTKLTGLSEGTIYYVKAYGTNKIGTEYGPEVSFTTAKHVNVVTTVPSGLAGTAANSGGEVMDVGYSVIKMRGICWDTLPNPSLVVNTKTAESFSGNGTGTFSSVMTGLRAGKTYYVRAYAVNAAGVSYGQQELITLPDSARVVTFAASSLFNTSATVGGNVISDGGAPVTERGVCWSETFNPTLANSYTSDGNGLGIFTSIITNLSQRVIYHYRAYAKNVIGVSYGEDRTFSIIPEAPVIITLDTRDITSMSAISGGKITSNMSAPITKRGLLWSVKGDPVDDKDMIITNDGSGVGEFPSNLMNLLGNTTYYIRAYAVNAYGIAYGNLLQFTTPPPVLPELNPPTISDVIDSTATGTFLLLNNGGALVSSRGLCYSTDRVNYTYVPSATINVRDIGTFTVYLSKLSPNTTYYVKAYAVNSVGTAYSSQTSFKTTGLPVLSTTAPNNIHGYDVYSGGTVVYVGDKTLQAKGVCWSPDSIPSVNLLTKTSESIDGTGLGSFTSHIVGLHAATKYYVRAYAVNSYGVGYGSLDSLSTDTLAFVVTSRPSAITSMAAVTGGFISSDGNGEVSSRGICWSTTANPTVNDSYTTNGSGAGGFVSYLNDLMGSTKYYVRAYAVNDVGISYGNLDSLKTAPPVLPVISSSDVINIGAKTAIGRGVVSSTGGSSVIERGICWNSTGNPTLNDSYTVSGSGLGNFAAGITGLSAVSTYYMRAYAINAVGVAYGEVVSFTTVTTATVVTSVVNSVTSMAATGGGEILGDGGAQVTNSGICWNITGNPTIDDTHTSCGIGIGTFIHSMTNLMGSTTYYVRAYAVNEAGIAYGQIETFTTEPPVLAIVTTNQGVSSGDGLHGTSGGSVLNNGGGTISVVGLVWSCISGFTPDTVVYNKTTQAGSGSFISVLSNLKRGQSYYVRAYVINSAGISYAGNEVTFTTVNYPVVTTAAPDLSSVTNVSAKAGGIIIDNGGADISESGICWSENILPTISDGHTINGPKVGNFTQTINGLMGSVTYYVRAYAINSVGISYGNIESFTTQAPVLATISTTTAYASSSKTAVGAGDISSNGGALVTTRGVVWSLVSGFNPDTVVFNKTATTGYYVGSFTANITGLQAQTVYYVRAYVENSVGISYGDEISFITPTLPTLTTVDAVANGPTRGISGGNITNDGRAGITARGVVYSTVMGFDPDTVRINKTSDGSGSGKYTSPLAELKGSTKYYVIAYATNIAGTAYGNEVGFTTDPPSLASVVTRDVWKVGGTSAYLGGYISDNGGEPITTKGMVWCTTSGFRPDTVVVNKISVKDSGNGNYESVIIGLKMGTVYYARALVVNSIGVAYGNEISFKTQDLPVLKTRLVSPSSSGYSAAGGGTLISDGGAAITNSGVCWSTGHGPTIGLYTKTTTDPWNGNDFYSSITDLKPVTTYYVRAYAVNSQGVAYGDEVSFTTPVALPILTTKVITPTSKSTMATGGQISSDGGGNITSRGIIWSVTPSFNPDTVAVNKTSDGVGVGTFTSIVTGLQMSTAYYMRAYATNSAGTAYGNQVTETIFPTAPMLKTMNPAFVTGYSSNSGGVITNNGGADITQKGLCWATHTNPTISDYMTNNGSGMDSFTVSMTNLQPNTMYYIRAYAVNKIGVAYGEEKTILTNGLPTLSATYNAANIIATTATSGGEITNDGRSSILSRGVCWSIYSNPTIDAASKTVDTTSHTIGNFICNISDLQPNTTYYVRAYATNAVGVGYGSEISFTTLPVRLPTLFTVKPSTVDSIAAVSGGNVTDDGGMPVTTRGVCWSTSSNPTISLATRNNNATGGLGLYTNKIVGLSPGTKYYVRAYAINSKGEAYGNLDSLTTMVVKPTISNVVMSDLTNNSGVSNAIVTNDGGAPVTDRGFCWNTTGNPTLADNPSSLGSGIGVIKDTIRDLNDTPTYYIRAYATNSFGTGYSPTITSFRLCPASFDITHAEGLNGAPVSKTVRYHSISTSIGGKSACWLTQNLGADRQAASIAETADDAAGWYWQFNRIQGYKHDGTTRTPSTPWVTSISENSNWLPSNDPCALLLGNGWRIPTMTEWTNAVTSMGALGQSPYASPLKLHYGGFLEASNASLSSRGSWSQAWSSTAISSTTASYIDFGNNGTLRMFPNNKWYGFSVRCIRDSLVITKPSVSKVALLNMNNTGVDLKASVTPDGGSPVTARGFCWNTTGKPTISDNPIALGDGVGIITTTLSGLKEGPTYYVRAYAINSAGVSYSSDSLGFKICRPTFTVQHLAGMNGAPESKTVVYHSINSTYSGAARCWITQNLGADSVASSIGDATVQAAGWYWQFNRVQGYAYATTRVPATSWTSISETSDWLPVNDPCAQMLGGGWRIPTSTEWSNMIATIQAKNESPYTSPLKLHYNGYIEARDAILYSRGSWATFWSSMETGTTSASYMDFGNNGTFRMFSNNKWYGFGLRCLRDTIVITVPSVSDVTTSNATASSAYLTAIISPDGGSPVTASGFCWNTTGNPTLSDNVVNIGAGLGSITTTLSSLSENYTYYVKAFATNSIGTAYSPTVTSFKVCPATFSVLHIQGLNGAPISKTVTYHSVSSNISGKAACWLTQNLGADQQATSLTDATEPSAGWYWQFNRSQGYQYTTNRTPSVAWANVTESSNWVSANDPCSLLLGGGWRIPTSTEYANVISNAAAQGQTPYTSPLQMHYSGFLEDTKGLLVDRGARGTFWSSTSTSTTSGMYYLFRSNTNNMYSDYKWFGFTLRCIRDTVFTSTPFVSTVSLTNMTNTGTNLTAAVASDGQSFVSERGFCWNTTGTPTLSDNVISVGSGIGTGTTTLTGLSEVYTYYVRAYATNSKGTSYSSAVTSFKVCPSSFSVQHIEGFNGAPVSKTVTYHSVSSNISGKAACWLTQNLGADQQATSLTDATEPSAGWYWQFNRSQGYQYTTNRTPSATWANVTESSNWVLANDPCFLLLGGGWRIPTSTEYANVISSFAAQGQTPYTSPLQMHYSGFLEDTKGLLVDRGARGTFWGSTSTSTTSGMYYLFNSSTNAMYNDYKWFGFTLRCIRDTVFASTPFVSAVSLTNITNSGANLTAAVTPDSRAFVTARGFCWNTTGTPTLSDNVISVGSGVGIIQDALSGLSETSTYYVRAYATNSKGTSYSPTVTSFKVCPSSFSVRHIEGFNGAPVSKIVTYHSVSSNISGKAACWLTQNLGADQQATSLTDATEPSAGWYWQFNRPQGYQYITSRTPSTAWANVTESSDWLSGNDPCSLLLGGGWRIPTSTEYANVISNAVAQGQTPYTSPLQMHYSGFLEDTKGLLVDRGVRGTFWGSTSTSTTSGLYYLFKSSTNNMYNDYKWFGFTLRCIRDSAFTSTPAVSVVSTSNIADSSVDLKAIVTPDGGSAIAARGFCWSTAGTPTLSDNIVNVGTGVGISKATLTGLSEAYTYSVRAYATNSIGTAYSPTVTTFKVCPSSFSVLHVAGLNGAPISKTVTYHSVSSNIGGKAACWLTQNLGADQQAISVTDATGTSAGWYWQFNRLQGYKYDGTIRTPSMTWITSISENSNWLSQNDPCSRLLGTGWRIPTMMEWSNADGLPQNWASSTDAYNSILKLHLTGWVTNDGGVLKGIGSTDGNYWSSTQYGSDVSQGYLLNMRPANCNVAYYAKSYAYTLRCVRDTFLVNSPSVSIVSTTDLTSTGVTLGAIVTPDGGTAVSARGFCWNTTGNPAISDNPIAMGSGTGTMTTSLTGLTDGPVYYVRAYAVNSSGISYSSEVTSFKACPASFVVAHSAGINGAPVTKTVTYNSVSTTASGKAACWLTQNLGADHLALSVTDATEASLGWHWQFNRLQGYKNDGATRTPSSVWITSISENNNWLSANDPCNMLLGNGWRIPTMTEWFNADSSLNWTTSSDAYNSILKLHLTGWLTYDGGVLNGAGSSDGNYWSATQTSDISQGYLLNMRPANCNIASYAKSYGYSLRCIKD